MSSKEMGQSVATPYSDRRRKSSGEKRGTAPPQCIAAPPTSMELYIAPEPVWPRMWSFGQGFSP